MRGWKERKGRREGVIEKDGERSGGWEKREREKIEYVHNDIHMITHPLSCGLEAEECWSLVQSFTHYHNQPPSLAFVTLCAKQGEWLPLLCHAEIYRIPPNKVSECFFVKTTCMTFIVRTL